MSESKMQFNALTDRWLPLVQPDGSTLWASPVEVICGERDGSDLDYPRDDFRVYGRLLLSALVQALFAAQDKAELQRRLDTPLSREQVEAVIRPVLTEFDLFGPTPFLQVLPPQEQPTKGAAPFVFAALDLYQPAILVDGVSVPIALVTLFIEQTYAGGAGRGYGAGPGGQPGAFTLIDTGSIRQTAWANTLAMDAVVLRYAKDDPHPWSNERRDPRPRAAVGIVGGLFFQPRSIWLIPVGDGPCSFSGAHASLVRLSPFLPKSSLTKKPTKGEDVWAHPCAPLAVNSQGIAAIRLNAERPAWTGLAQLLDPISRDRSKIAHPLEGPAQVLKQWRLLRKKRRPQLIILDFERDKANIKQRFFESFPLSDLISKPEPIEQLRALIDDSRSIESALEKALTRAHDDRKIGGLAIEDARAAFWKTTEAPFLSWLDTVSSLEGETPAEWDQIRTARDAMLGQLRRAAMAIFNAHVELSEFDPRKQKRVAMARRSLFKFLRPQINAATQPTEVTP